MRRLQVTADIKLTEFPGQKVVSFSPSSKVLRDWCLGISLLKEQLIKELYATDEAGKNAHAVIRVLEGSGSQTMSRVLIDKSSYQIELAPVNVEYVQHFFLKYYRDGAADVDHIDLEGIDVDTGAKDISVTFKVSQAKASVTAKEAERRLREIS
jgi:hypothetical protein